jgi:hypothetical protein
MKIYSNILNLHKFRPETFQSNDRIKQILLIAEKMGHYGENSLVSDLRSLFKDDDRVKVDGIFLPLNDFAQAAKMVYEDDSSFGGYWEENAYEDGGFKAVFLRNETSNSGIISIRGTANGANLLFDAIHIPTGGALWCKPSANSKIVKYATKGLLKLLKDSTFNDSLCKLQEYISQVLDTYSDTNIFITGHSLGGFLAQIFAVEFKLEGESFNGPALGSYVAPFPKFSKRKNEYLASHL